MMALLVYNSSRSSCSFSGGKQISIVSVSSSIPRKASEVVGPSTLDYLKGTPSVLHTLLMMAWLVAHSLGWSPEWTGTFLYAYAILIFAIKDLLPSDKI